MQNNGADYSQGHFKLSNLAVSTSRISILECAQDANYRIKSILTYSRGINNMFSYLCLSL